MEPITVSVLAAVAVTELVKTLARGSGEAGFKLLPIIRDRFRRDEKAERALDNFESDPAEYENVFKKNLERLLAEDPAFFTKVADVAWQGNLLRVTASGESDVSEIDQSAKGSGHREEVEASEKARITGVRQRSED
jgi:hypothetical protein